MTERGTTTEPGTDATLQVGGIDRELSARLDAELTAYNIRATGADDQAGLSVRVTDAAGELVGGLSGWTWGGCGGIEGLWVREDRRHEGWGSRLLRAAEEEARQRGCTRMTVSSLTFQAPPFYRRHGYLETGRTEGLTGGHADVHFWKRLDGTETRERLRIVTVIDLPNEQPEEQPPTEALSQHGGRLEQRLRTADSRTEIHVMSFASREGYQSFLEEHGLPGRVLEVREV